MTHRDCPDPGEDDLRQWAGGILTGDPWTGSPPVSDSSVRHFLRHHGLEAILCQRALVHPGSRPPLECKAQLERAVASELAAREEFLNVLRGLQGRPFGPPIVCKGQSLAYSVYREPWHRPRVDIDILTARDDFEAVCAALVELGYHQTNAVDGDLVSPQRIFSKHRYHLVHTWDVHSRASHRPAFAECLAYSRLRQSAVEITMDDLAFLAPGTADSLLLACLHLVGHHGGDIRLIWLYDIHLLADRLDEDTRKEFLQHATSRGEVHAACRDALTVTCRYLRSDSTEALRRSLGPESTRGRALNPTYLRRLAGDLRALPRGQRLRFVRQHLFPSPDYMARRFGLRRRWQVPLWYFVRIGRAVPKLFRRR